MGEEGERLDNRLIIWSNIGTINEGDYMSFTDPISDMITRIRNAQMRLLTTVKIPNSKFRAKILDVLKVEGYISDYKFLIDYPSHKKR